MLSRNLEGTRESEEIRPVRPRSPAMTMSGLELKQKTRLAISVWMPFGPLFPPTSAVLLLRWEFNRAADGNGRT